jgi:hypothetical protein
MRFVSADGGENIFKIPPAFYKRRMKEAARMLRWRARIPGVTIIAASIILYALGTADGFSPPGETRKMTVQVNDKDGNPLPGATVIPIGLRSKEEPGDYYGWRHVGKTGSEAVITDSNGEASIVFPIHPMENLMTGTVILLVQHPEACTTHVELNVDSPKAITLVPGTNITFSVQPVPGIPFSHIYADLVDSHRDAGYIRWNHSPDDKSVSTHLPDGDYLVRIVATSANGKLYFSDSSSFSLTGSSELTREFIVHPGGSQKGIIDPAVPRPIKNGWVVADVSWPERDPSDRGGLTSHWRTFTDVAEDGSFTLTNLPAGSLEIVAGSEGYVSTDLSGKALSGILQAQAVTRDEQHPITIAMDPTGGARITVTDPDGKVLPGAKVYFDPNQMLGEGTSILGAKFKSEEMLPIQDKGPEFLLEKFKPQIPSFSATTDGNGVAVVRELPVGDQTFYVVSASLDMPIEEDRQPRRLKRITIEAARETASLVEMEVKGSTSLSGAIEQANQARGR